MAIGFLSLSELSGADELLCEFKEAALEYIGQAEDMDAEQILAAIFNGCLIFRLYSSDTGYYFEAPIPLSESADIGGAYNAIYDYCLREAIPTVIVDVPGEDAELATEGMSSAVLTEMGDGAYLLELLTECMRCEELPERLYDRVYLGEFAASYAPDYARLIEDRELNKYYGYDATEDIKALLPTDYIDAVRGEFRRGESMTFAATVLNDDGENAFVGEGVLYAFDGRGNATAAFRVLPEHQGQGLGREIFIALTEIAKEIGLDRVKCDVKLENEPSLRLLSRFGTPYVSGGAAHFEFALPVDNI